MMMNFFYCLFFILFLDFSYCYNYRFSANVGCCTSCGSQDTLEIKYYNQYAVYQFSRSMALTSTCILYDDSFSSNLVSLIGIS